MCEQKHCSQCPALLAEIAALKAEIQRLHRIIRRLKRCIKHLRKQLDVIETICIGFCKLANRVLAEHQPRGTWSLWKGKRIVADTIRRRARPGC